MPACKPKKNKANKESATKTADTVMNIFLYFMMNIVGNFQFLIFNFHFDNPELNKNLVIFPSPKKTSAERKTLVMVMAENIEIITPIPSVSANPFIKDVPNQKRISAV